MCLQCKSFENTLGKGEIARNEQFLLFPQCFLPIWRTYCHFFFKFEIVDCKLFQFGSLKFVAWERVKTSSAICFNLDQSKTLLFGNGLTKHTSFHTFCQSIC